VIDIDNRRWEIIFAVASQCKKTFECDSMALHSDGTVTARIYADYRDPTNLIKKFEAAGGQVINISHQGWNWYDSTFKVLE